LRTVKHDETNGHSFENFRGKRGKMGSKVWAGFTPFHRGQTMTV